MSIRSSVNFLRSLLESISGDGLLRNRSMRLDSSALAFIEANKDRVQMNLDNFSTLVIHHINSWFIGDALKALKSFMPKSIINNVTYTLSKSNIHEYLDYVVHCNIPISIPKKRECRLYSTCI